MFDIKKSPQMAKITEFLVFEKHSEFKAAEPRRFAAVDDDDIDKHTYTIVGKII